MWLAYALAAVLAWGVWGYLSKVIVDEVGAVPTFIVLGIASGVVSLVVLAFRGLPPVMPRLPLYASAGLLYGLGGFLFYLAMERGRASAVVPISAQYVVVAAILAFVLLREPLTARRVLGVVTGVGAIVLLAG